MNVVNLTPKFSALSIKFDELFSRPQLSPFQQESDNVFSELKSGGDAVTSLGASSIDDMNKLLEFLAEANLDPNDPSDAKLLQLFPVSS